MRTLSPYSQEYECAASSVKFYLNICETFTFAHPYCTYSIDVDCTVLKTGEHGDLEISPEDFKIKSINLIFPNFSNPLKLDEQNLREDHAILWFQLENDLDLAILKHASKSSKWSAV